MTCLLLVPKASTVAEQWCYTGAKQTGRVGNTGAVALVNCLMSLLFRFFICKMEIMLPKS